MNIVHLVSNKTWGGGERYVLDLCRRCSAEGHSVAVGTRRSEAVDKPFANAGFTPGHLPLRGAVDFLSPMMLARVLNRMDAPTVLHAHNFKDAYTAVRARRLMKEPGKVRVVVTRHLVKAAKDSSMERDLYRQIDDIIFVSEAARQAFVSGRPGCDEAKLHVVHNSIMPPEPAPKTPSDTVRLLYAGRIAPEKGIDVLIDALATLGDLPLRLTVAGVGNAKTVMPLMEKCRRLGLEERVDWAGHVDDIYTAISDADIGVLPTTVPESFGLAVLEFMSQGVPPIASNAGGPTEIITDGTDGLLVRPGNAISLAAAIRLLATDSGRREQMAEKAARTFSDRFAYDRFYNSIMTIYEGSDRDKR